MKKLKNISLEDKERLDAQIKEKQNVIDYDTKDFTIELMVHKFQVHDFLIPSYQRNFIWREADKNLFLESIFLGLPIPFMFLADCEDGRQEIIDGAQRMQTIVEFVAGKLKISGLKKLNELNGFYFNDLSVIQQRKFLNKILRIVILAESTPHDVRQDLFHRINKSGVHATDSEVRRGAFVGKLTDFIDKCANDRDFQILTPMAKVKVERFERFELVLRFFAYVNSYQDFIHDVNIFLDEFLKNNLNDFDESCYASDFYGMVKFVKNNFENGFAKTRSSKITPRVRFEAISVGVGLALRIKPNLEVKNIDWLDSKEFRKHTTSDASNNQGKLQRRVEFVRDQLLKEND